VLSNLQFQPNSEKCLDDASAIEKFHSAYIFELAMQGTIKGENPLCTWTPAFPQQATSSEKPAAKPKANAAEK
jgi:hypothetical protein